MIVSHEKTGDLTSLIKIEIEENDYRQEVEKQLKEQRRKAVMPGFRQGQVPMQIIKKTYETTLRAQEIEKVMSGALYSYIDAQKLNVLGTPMANDEKTPQIDWEKDKNYTFYFDIAVQPEFELDLKKVKTTYYNIEPTEETMNKFIEDIRLRYGKLLNPETVGEKDMLYGKIEELDENGEKKAEGVETNATIFVDRIALATIRKKFEGKKVGATIKFQPHKAFKDPQQLATVLHKKVDEVKEFVAECNYTIDSIQRMEMAEMNEEFFDRAYKGKGIKTEEEFRQVCKEDLCKTNSQQADNYFLNQTSQMLVDTLKIDLPEEFLKKWMIATSEGKMTEEDMQENGDKYLQSIKWQLIEGKLSEQYNLNVSKEEAVNYYKTEVLPSYFPPMPDMDEAQQKEADQRLDKIANDLIQEKEASQQVFNFLMDRKMIQCLKENTSLSEKTLDMDAFIKEVEKNNEAAQKKAKN